MRVAAGFYEDVHCSSMWVGIVLGLLQTLMAGAAMAINMRLVSTAEAVLDAFLNFIALSFLTDVDNIVMDSKVVKGMLKWAEKEELDTEVVIRRVSAQAAAGWTPTGKMPL